MDGIRQTVTANRSSCRPSVFFLDAGGGSSATRTGGGRFGVGRSVLDDHPRGDLPLGRGDDFQVRPALTRTVLTARSG